MSKPSAAHVERLLNDFIRSPVDSQSLDERDLGALHVFLMGIPQNSAGELHWFCENADKVTRNAAIFLIRLKSYSGPNVERWEERLNQCLFSCSACTQAFEEAKITSRQTFLAAFPERLLLPFFEQFELSESSAVFKRLELLGFLQDGQPTPQSLSTVPAPILYRLVSNWTVFSDPRTESLISTHPPPTTPSSWPENPVPPGLLVLLLHRDEKVRRWASSHTTRSSILPGDAAGFYPQALALVAHALHPLPSNFAGPSSSMHLHQRVLSCASSFPFAEGSVLWSGINAVLRLLPPQWVKSTPVYSLDLRDLVLKNLSRQDSSFPDVFRCFILLLKRLGKGIWEGAEVQPHTVIEAIVENPAYLESLRADASSSSTSAQLESWIREFLTTVASESAQKEVTARLSGFLLRDHVDHPECRLILANVGVSFLSSEVRKRHKDPMASSLLHSHAKKLSTIAYGSEFKEDIWNATRKEALSLVLEVLNNDIGRVKFCVDKLNRAFSERASTTSLPSLAVNKSLWTHIRTVLQSAEAKAVADMLPVIARLAHISSLNTSIFNSENPTPAFLQLLYDVNECLELFQTSICEPILHFTDNQPTQSGLAVVNANAATRSITLLLCSPSTTYQTAAQSIIGLAFDVDGRMECFKALLTHRPGETLDGLADFLYDFKSYASSAVEACTLASVFLRCFTDILSVFSTPGGALQSGNTLRAADVTGPSGRIVKVWKAMTSALCVVFSQAPQWAPHFDSSEMVLWIRDALILARDMLEKWTTLENAASSDTEEQPTEGRLSSVGKVMMEALQRLIPDASRWLRITDEELLYQSFQLIQSLLETMHEYRVTLGNDTLGRLMKVLDIGTEKGKGKEGKAESVKTKLSPDRCDILRELVSRFVPKKREEPVEPERMEAGPSKSKTEVKTEKPALPVAPRPSTKGKEKAASAAVRNAPQPKQIARKSVAPPPPKPAVPAVLPRLSSSSRRSSTSSASSRQSMDVSDDSESDDEDSDAEGASRVSALGRIDKKPPVLPRKPVEIKAPAMPRQIKTMAWSEVGVTMPGGGRPRNSPRDRAARLKPNISGFHRTLLSWSYADDGPLPPANRQRPLPKVPDQFSDYDHFFRVFETLLVAECWAQLQQSKDEKQDSFGCRIESCHYVDSWVEMRLAIPGGVEKGWYLAETDVVLLEKGSEKVLAKVVSYKSAPQIETLVRIASSSKTVALSQGAEWQLSKVFSLSTLHREYGALVSLRHNAICDTVLRPKLTVASNPRADEVQEVMKLYKLNEPQATAILKVMSTDGFSLIQGPPGTGKTSTICGLVARFMTKRRKPPVQIQPGTNKSSTPEQKARILLCAPSNAAIDEIANRVKRGYTGPNGARVPLNVVRIGAEQAMNVSTRDISLDYLVDQKIGNTPAMDTSELESTKIELDSVREKINAASLEIQKLHDNDTRKITLQHEIERLHAKRRQLRDRQNNLRDEKSSASRALDTQRRNARAEILNSADVICTTLSGAGHESLESLDFDTIIIDEAAQAIEPSSLIPLKYDFTRCVLVGDPQQLPPTVISQEASRQGYNQSLFVRLQRSQEAAVHLLSIQYRMHPDISTLPSNLFYNGKLLDAPNMAEKTKRPWHDHPKFGTYKFLNVSHGMEEQSGRSIKNLAECDTVVSLFGTIRSQFSNLDFGGRIGVVSMYRAQIVELRRQFENRFGRDISKKIDFNTVDGFQGQEKDIIILSCVRGGPGLDRVGFLADVRRMNVALTRAKASLFIVGNAATLERSDDVWKQIVSDARTRSVLIEASASYFMKRTLSPPPKAPAKQPRLQPTTSSTPPEPPLHKPNEPMKKKPLNTTPIASSSTSDPQPPRGPPPAANSNNHRVPSGVKRPADDVDTSKEGSTRNPAGHPPIKRPRKEPNLFIPKKKR